MQSGTRYRRRRPVVSVVMPAYNSERYIDAAVESILAQRYRDFELLVIDDGSRDGTAERVAAIAHRDARVRLISQENTGIVGALNHGLSLCRAPLIARMDADDIAFRDRFTCQLNFLNRHPEAVLVGSPVIEMTEQGRIWGLRGEEFEHEDLVRVLLGGKSGSIMHPTIMMRREALDQAGHYREEFRHVEDLDLFLRMAEVGEIRNVRQPLLKYRLHGQSICHQHRDEQKEIKKRVIRDALDRRRRQDETVVINYSHESSNWFYNSYNGAVAANYRDRPARACAMAAMAIALRPTRPESWLLARDFSNPVLKRLGRGVAAS